jgi:hypothetical protein
MIRIAHRLAALVLLALAAPALAASEEYYTDRPGGNLKMYELEEGEAHVTCSARCDAYSGCESWTYVKPGIQGPKGRCYVKTGVPAPVRNNCCVSGVRKYLHFGTVDRPGEMAKDMNLPGGDYYSQPVASTNECITMCKNQPVCRAWTYVHPGVQGPRGMCWLKNSVPKSVASGCCVSGVER